MEAIKTRLKSIAWFLTALMLFQSCVVYHKTPTTLDNASRDLVRTKITNPNGESFTYKYITYEDGVYYGVNKASGKWIKTPLDNRISNVYTKNNEASTWLTVGIIGLPTLLFIIGGILVFNDTLE